MAGHQLIEAHLAELRRRLPADAVDELADRLTESAVRNSASTLRGTRTAPWSPPSPS
jgi:hypothetical protein